jgi:hypothetical protein
MQIRNPKPELRTKPQILNRNEQNPTALSAFRLSNPAFRRLILFAGLFVIWIGWLAYLAITATRPTVLSRPQFLVSRLDVIAELHANNGKPALEVDVREVYWAAKGMEKPAKKITVVNLDKCDGYAGAGPYILPLTKDKGDQYQVAKIPLSPGFNPSSSKPRIYPETPETLRQLQSIHK